MKNENTLREFIQKIWNEKDITSIPKFVTNEYTIHLDNADPWEGKTLNHDEFKLRLDNSFIPFPDINFDIKTLVADGNCVSISWVMTGTNLGNLGNVPATLKPICTEGITIYYFKDDKICGHSQVFDRTTIMKQLGFSA
jgi:steroid delta-isomerase-like uncharacterized protein